MNEALTVAIAIPSTVIVGGIISLIKMGMKVGRMQQKQEDTDRRILEDREKNEEKFDDLYRKTNEHDSLIATLTATLTSTAETCKRIENKIDRRFEQEIK